MSYMWLLGLIKEEITEQNIMDQQKNMGNERFCDRISIKNLSIFSVSNYWGLNTLTVGKIANG